eukprot:scaffold114_cov361-Pinguiococcus_pyrenoidosus.AAC.29
MKKKMHLSGRQRGEKHSTLSVDIEADKEERQETQPQPQRLPPPRWIGASASHTDKPSAR